MVPIQIGGLQELRKEAGPGLRSELFFYGCDIGCRGCINSWRKDEPPANTTVGEVFDQIMSLDNRLLTIGGGEPFRQPNALLALLYLLRTAVNSDLFSIILYTGHAFNQVILRNRQLVVMVDMLVSGPYVEARQCLFHELRFIGSSNQIITCLHHSSPGSPAVTMSHFGTNEYGILHFQDRFVKGEDLSGLPSIMQLFIPYAPSGLLFHSSSTDASELLGRQVYYPDLFLSLTKGTNGSICAPISSTRNVKGRDTFWGSFPSSSYIR